VSANKTLALTLYQRAAKMGDAQGLFNVGEMLRQVRCLRKVNLCPRELNRCLRELNRCLRELNRCLRELNRYAAF
jgi:hypothetical protein